MIDPWAALELRCTSEVSYIRQVARFLQAPLSGSLEVGHPQKSRTWRQLPAAEVVPRAGSCLRLQHRQSWAVAPQCRGLVHSSYLAHIYNFVLGSSPSWKLMGLE